MSTLPSSAVFAVVVAVVMLALWRVENALGPPDRGPARRGHLLANVGLTVVALALNATLIAATAGLVGTLRARGVGLFASVPTPGIVELVVGVAVLDLATYVAHRVMHAVPVLWRAHSVHHADPLVDVSTTLRQHPGETLVRFAFVLVPAVALGLPAWVVVTYRAMSFSVGLFEHVDVWLPASIERIVALVVTTPGLHKRHHSRDAADAGANFGNLLTLYDRVFGTLRPAATRGHVTYGVA